jgi:hypothetical protein
MALTKATNRMIADASVNVKDFGAVGDGVTDDTAAIQAAITVGGNILIPAGTYLITSGITVGSNVHIKNEGTLQVTPTASTIDAFTFSAKNNSSFSGGYVIGTTSVDNGTCFVLSNSSYRITIADVTITDFQNKGVDIQTAAYENNILRVKVVNASGTTGSGLSVWGAGVDRPDKNSMVDCVVTGSRGGISVQGGFYNKVVRPHVESCSLWGVGLDGVITGAGDGAQYTLVDSPVVIDVPNVSYAGIYLGNGSANNTIVNARIMDCVNGIKSSSTTPLLGTIIDGVKIDGNTDALAAGVTGISLASAPKTLIISPNIKNLTLDGIKLFECSNSSIRGGEVSECDIAGVYLQSNECIIADVFTHNNKYGFRVEFGGAGTEAANASNRFYNCKASSNVTLQFKNAITGTKIHNVVGHSTSASGSATILNTATSVVVTHGLAYTPAVGDIVVIPTSNPSSLVSWWVGNLTSTTFQITSSTAATVNVGFGWSAQDVIN